MEESCRDSRYAEIVAELCPELKTTPSGKALHSRRLPFLRNVVTVHALAVDQLNAYDVLVNDEVLFTEAALAEYVSRSSAGERPAPAPTDASETEEEDS